MDESALFLISVLSLGSYTEVQYYEKDDTISLSSASSKARGSNWFLKSLRNGSSLNWTISDFQRQPHNQAGKESYNCIPLRQPSPAVENHKEGRASPEQEAEEMEDQYDEEPTSKFAESLFTAKDNIKDKKIQKTFILENNTATKLRFFLKNSSNQQNALPANNVPLENNSSLEVSTNPSSRLQAPLKIPRIILTHPSTSDEDIDQLTQDQEIDLEETDITDDHLFLDCLNISEKTS
ncbi:uncharacterized protein [Pyxicephalus adspersus]|uniref:uncharacterized protein n=1 Tax=Pyxicephalus adspersus TaxID=30357 RepID=UPI003B5C70BE